MIAATLISLAMLLVVWVVVDSNNLAYAPLICGMTVGFYPFWADQWLPIWGMTKPAEVGYLVYSAFFPLFGAIHLFHRSLVRITVTYALILTLGPASIDILSGAPKSGIDLASIGAWAIGVIGFAILFDGKNYLLPVTGGVVLDLIAYFALAELTWMDTVTTAAATLEEEIGYYLTNIAVSSVLIPLYSLPIWWKRARFYA